MGSAELTTQRPTSLLEVERPLRPVQWSAVLGSIAVLVWSLPGLIINPDFSLGDSASAVRVLGVDMNGWHAVSGFLVAIPGLFAALRASWSALFNLAAAGALILTGIWALADAQVYGGILYLPNGGADALLHFSVSAIFLAGAASYYLSKRRTA